MFIPPFEGRTRDRYFVHYHDGFSSCRMPKQMALNYAEIFGGKVYRITFPHILNRRWHQMQDETVREVKMLTTIGKLKRATTIAFIVTLLVLSVWWLA